MKYSPSTYQRVQEKYAVKRASVIQPEHESFRFISLTLNQIAVVDAADYDWLNQWNWGSQWDRHTRSFYAYRNFKHHGKTVRVLMHRQIVGLDSGDIRIVDHKDHDTLNNRRSNLRVASQSENGHNRTVNINHSVGLKGVSKHGNKWRARIKVKGKTIILGSSFDTAELAHAAYCAAASDHFGEFANGHYPPSKYACWCGDSNCTEHP